MHAGAKKMKLVINKTVTSDRNIRLYITLYFCHKDVTRFGSFRTIVFDPRDFYGAGFLGLYFECQIGVGGHAGKPIRKENQLTVISTFQPLYKGAGNELARI